MSVAHWVHRVIGNAAGQAGVAMVDAASLPDEQDPPVRLFVPPGHFYSPIVNPAEIDKTALAASAAEMPGVAAIDIDSSAMLQLWNSSREILKECSFPDNAVDGKRYYFENEFYSFGDAITLYMMLRTYKPRRIVEVGSGFSSACTLDTIDEHFKHDVSLAFIEPNSYRLKELLRQQDFARTTIIEKPVQQVDLGLFDALTENDVLFIDSTHVSKTGSDVNHIIFNILPRLNAGVLVHFHDIFFPFEYPSVWAIEQNRSWNEAYLLKAFLMYNPAFQVLFFNDYFARKHGAAIQELCPAFLRNAGGAIWLRKRTGAGERMRAS